MCGLSSKYALSALLFAVAILCLLSVSQVEAAIFTEWTIPTANSEPERGIFVSGGLVYFDENVGNKIGRLDPASGVFTEWTVPTASSQPIGVAVDSGFVYFTEFHGNKIGRLSGIGTGTTVFISLFVSSGSTLGQFSTASGTNLASQTTTSSTTIVASATQSTTSSTTSVGDIFLAPLITSTTTTVTVVPEYPLSLVLLLLALPFSYALVRHRILRKQKTSVD